MLIPIALLLLWCSYGKSKGNATKGNAIIYIECNPGKAYYISDFLEEMLIIERVPHKVIVEPKDVIIVTISHSYTPKIAELLDSLPHYIKKYKVSKK